MENQETMQVSSAKEKRKFKLPKPEFLKKMPKWQKVIIILAIIAAIIVGAFAMTGKKSVQTAFAYSEYTVKRGDVSVMISGSGSVRAIDQYDVTSLVKGEILTSPVEEGDEVQKGDVLYTIDSKDVQNNLRRAENSLEKAQTSYENARKKLNDATTVSPIGGVVTNVYVKKGDNVSAGGKIMEVTDRSMMLLEVPFISAAANSISVGSEAEVTVSGSYYTISGVVTRVAGGSSISSEGVEVKTVEIKVANPGAISAGDKASAIIGGIAGSSEGTFANCEVKTITAKASGEVIYQPYKVGDKVSAGEAVLKIDDSDLRENLKSAQLSLSDAQLSLDSARDSLDNYTITAPISGKIIQKNSKAGDTLDNTNSQTVLCTIADLSKIVFEISVDELDIAKIAVDQSVEITADAFEDEIFEGRVDYISTIGTAQNGVTSYPVRIEILNPGSLIIGMNVNAKIVVEEKLDVIYVPVGAVSRGNTVMVKKASKTEDTKKDGGKAPGGAMAPNGANEMPQGNTNKSVPGALGNTKGIVPDGFEIKKVQLGINNDENIEVISGLSEGDVVLVTATASTGQGSMMFPGMGGMSGGMPSMGGMSGAMGGAPRGAMPSGGGR